MVYFLMKKPRRTTGTENKMNMLLLKPDCTHLPWQMMTWEYERRCSGGFMVCSEAPDPEDIFTWPPYSCSDLGAPYWVCTSRRPLGSLCSSSEQFCCTPAASRWSPWTAPGGTRRQDVIRNGLSYLICLHRSAEFGLRLTKPCHKPIFSLCYVPQTFKLWASCHRSTHDQHVWLTFK